MKLVWVMLAALPVVAAAGDLSGKWKIEGDVAGHPVIMSCAVEQNAEAKVSGKCALGDGAENVTIAGSAKGEKFQFSFTTSSGYTLEYTGALEGDTMKGDIAVEGATGFFSGKRAKE